ncbi:FGGY-family carbohydrate kinase [Anaerofilum sp. BX8]|uniref:FGGY-family carbohydrate kinase n=1 Tax=Anaerofilum hominis TaxID=2763016 RepID=A0A923REV6_9FIRM|nr:FGGY-family carbohydrate kinase [Anaerofilum hominis]MBC5582497.1 FGGY-family carbohydrate kinase [Anaerofilum hominis]
MAKFFLGIDIGTYESKGVLIDGECRVMAIHAERHGLENPRENYFEHDAEKVWWGDFCKITHALLQKTGIKNSEIAAVGASTLGADLVAVDEDCRPLRKAILYGIDARAEKEIAQLNRKYGLEKVLEFNGRPLCSNDVPPKILWLKNNEPEVYDKAYKFLTGSSFITAKLTGCYVIDRFLAYGAFTPLYDPRDGSVDMEYCETFCRPDQLARVCDTTDVVGTVTRRAAADTGLKEGTPVIAGADDSAAEAISTGVLEKGDMMVQIGSSLYLIGLCDKLIKDSRVWSGGFLIPGTFSVQGGTNNAGTLTRWYRDNIFFDKAEKEEAGGPNAYQAMLEGIEEIPPGSEGLITLPYFAGERTPINDPRARGLLFGLTLRHTRKHMYRSALEAVGYSLAQHFRIFQENQVDIRTIYAVGGGTKSPVWMQIISDILGIEIVTADVTVGASFGDAVMAAIGVGHFGGFGEIRSHIRPGQRYYPNKKDHELYQPYVKIFGELYHRNRDLMHSL